MYKDYQNIMQGIYDLWKHMVGFKFATVTVVNTDQSKLETFLKQN